MRIIIIEHDDSSLMCVHEKVCDRLYESDQIFIPIPMPKIIPTPIHISQLAPESLDIPARAINIIDLNKAKQLLHAGLNIILEGTLTDTMHKNLEVLFKGDDCQHITLAPNNPQTIIRLSSLNETIDVNRIQNSDIVDAIVAMIHEKTANK